MCVERRDCVMSSLQRLAKLTRDAYEGSRDIGFWHSHLSHIDTVEASRELPDRGITTTTDLFDDGSDGRNWAFFSEIGARELKRVSDFAPSQI